MLHSFPGSSAATTALSLRTSALQDGFGVISLRWQLPRAVPVPPEALTPAP